MNKLFIVLPFVSLFAIALHAETPSPAYWKMAPTPPMGWNSYDSFGDNVTEEEILANARYQQEHLLSHGWKYVVVDYRWYDPGAHDNNPNGRAGAKLAADRFGRLVPAPNRFPSAAAGKGFKPLADRLHAMGLKFGIHVMRGIPRQSVKANTPIEGSDFKAADAANTANICPWCPDMFGVDADKPAGQAWYDSILRQYADWGVDFVKVDDLSSPYAKRRNRGDPPGDQPLRPRHRLQHLARRDPGERSGARRDACEHVADLRRLLGQLGFAQPQLRPARRMARDMPDPVTGRTPT